MHFYICPYCPPCPEARLVESTMEDVKCKYDIEETCEEKHKCKTVMQCEKCNEVFTVGKVFLREQKRKIKDG